MQLDQVKAAITGGASGLGLAVAERLIREGASVALLDVQDDKGAAAVAQLGARARYFRTDVTNEDGVTGSLKAASIVIGGINAVINCAGVLGAGRVLGKQGPMPLAQFESTIRVNLVGSFNVAKAGAQIMQNNAAGDDGERGVIINTASVAAFEGQIGQAAYSASKGGIVGMTLPMARELSRFGIRVMTIAPGIFMTPMAGGMPDEVKASLEAMVPFPSRLGEPAEFADAVCFILQNRYMNGTTLRLDGAVRMQPK
ncbi:MAG: SDR family NAD(P)-dependent oxidoreductase [Xanthomonadales bacterium]|nr:SDR family NAD(P)-dependent oxidoreductase [Xanthomonadales bacterium]MCP5474069.1 SDR family NAD(P)-dependent oxidoreductase [Rhodanobacteraceae bacterium]